MDKVSRGIVCQTVYSTLGTVQGDLSSSVRDRTAVDEALERHFSVKEIAELWGLCDNSVRELFKNEPGIVRIQRPKSRWKRAYTTIRIPKSVLERVHRRMSLVA